MKRSIFGILLFIVMVACANFVYANPVGSRSIYKINPGESYILDGIVTAKDGKKKKVRLIVRVPHAGSKINSLSAEELNAIDSSFPMEQSTNIPTNDIGLPNTESVNNDLDILALPY